MSIARLALAVSPELSDWRDEALCREIDPELWFPERGGSTREAKRMCQRCPVQAECLTDALARDERFGVWGGLSERERRALTRQRSNQAAAVAAPATRLAPAPEDL